MEVFMTTSRPGPVLALVLLLALPSACAVAQQSAQPSALPPELRALKQSLEKYQDPYVAVRDGYFSTVGCVEYPKPGGHGQIQYPAGAMGVHFLNPSLVGPTVDPKRPSLLLYEPTAEGKLKLVGAEWFVPLATGIKERPQLFGRPFDGPMEGHEPLLPESLHHYDLHVWLWKDNPTGLFSPTNPNVKCVGYPFRLIEDAPKIVGHPH